MKLDWDCVARFYKKDEAAVNRVYALTHRLLRHVAYDVLFDLDLAQDCAMEAYESVLYSQTQIKGPGPFVAYLCTAAKNAAISKKRKMDRELQLDEEAVGIDEPQSDKGLLGLLRSELGYPDYDIVILHAVEGYSFVEIAQYLSLGTPSSVRGRYARAKKKAKALLEQEGL